MYVGGCLCLCFLKLRCFLVAVWCMVLCVVGRHVVDALCGVSVAFAVYVDVELFV